jgi:hypothetical protein
MTQYIRIDNPPFVLEGPQGQSAAEAHAWHHAKQALTIGQVLTGQVFAQAVFGVFFDAGLAFPVRMNITDFGIGLVRNKGVRFPNDYPALQSRISGKLAGFDEIHHQFVVQHLVEQDLSSRLAELGNQGTKKQCYLNCP